VSDEADVLRQLTDRLAQTAARLREEQLDPTEAASLVEECARLAGEAATELDRRVRAAAESGRVPDGQGELLA
jgi:hypothetical protein